MGVEEGRKTIINVYIYGCVLCVRKNIFSIKGKNNSYKQEDVLIKVLKHRFVVQELKHT